MMAEDEFISTETTMDHRDAVDATVPIRNVGNTDRKSYVEHLKYLAQMDELSKFLNGMKQSLLEITANRLPELEKQITPESFEHHVVHPHREQTEKLQQTIRKVRDLQQNELQKRTLLLLRSNVPLETSLRLVSILRQQTEYLSDSRKLAHVFLEARTIFIVEQINKSIIMKRDLLDDTKLLQALLKIMQGPVLDVASQYQALFPDQQHLLSKFIIERMDWLISNVTTIVSRARNTLILASYWNQLVSLHVAYSNIGASFMSLLESAFVERATDLLTDIASNGIVSLQARLKEARPKKGYMTQFGGKDIVAPVEIFEDPKLAPIWNYFVEIFENVRVFAVPAMRDPVNILIKNQLEQTKGLLYKEEPFCSSFDQIMTKSITQIVDLYFPILNSSVKL